MAKRKKKNSNIHYQYFILFTILITIYYCFHFRHGIVYYINVLAEKFDFKLNDSNQSNTLQSYDIRNVEILDRHHKKVFGLDISHYQANIKWDKMSHIYNNYPIDFIFIRSTMGGNTKDYMFDRNWKLSKKHNIIRGAYHFYRPDENSSLQAMNFIKTVKLEKGDLPPVLDIETLPRVQRIDSLILGLKNWCSIIKNHYKVDPIIYTSQRYYEDYLLGNFDDNILWIANYNFFVQDLKPEWKFWQFSEKAKIDGVTNGCVDLNMFNGSKTELIEYCIK